MVLVNTIDKGFNKKSNIIPFKLDVGIPQEKIEWNMSKRILVGKRSDGYQIMQALMPLFDMGYILNIRKGGKGSLHIDLCNDKGKVLRSVEGTSLSVALRRLSIGMSKQFSHMTE